MKRGIATSLVVVGLLALLAAGFFLINTPILKMSGPNAFEAIEERYVDPQRVNQDAGSREQYDFYKSWIMGNEPALRAALRQTRTLGIAFSLLVSVGSFGMAYYVIRGAPPNKPLQPTSGGRASSGSGSMGGSARG